MIYLGYSFASVVPLTILFAVHTVVLDIVNKLISAYLDDLFLLTECLHPVRLLLLHSFIGIQIYYDHFCALMKKQNYPTVTSEAEL